MDKAALKEFRAKLVEARKFSKLGGYFNLAMALDYAGFVEWRELSEQVRDWYHTETSTITKAAMWDNSIAAIDKQISELHQ